MRIGPNWARFAFESVDATLAGATACAFERGAAFATVGVEFQTDAAGVAVVSEAGRVAAPRSTVVALRSVGCSNAFAAILLESLRIGVPTSTMSEPSPRGQAISIFCGNTTPGVST